MDSQLTCEANDFLYFSLAIDESTDISDTAQPAVFIPGVDKNLKLTEELLDLASMKDTTTAADIFQEIEIFSKKKKKVGWKKLTALATDEAPAMSSSKNGVVAKVKKNCSR